MVLRFRLPDRERLLLLGSRAMSSRIKRDFPQRDLLSWIVTELQPFSSIETQALRSISADLHGVTLPFGSRHTLQRRIESDFAEYSLKLKRS
ncbi:hypothetical protein V1520DRAFT_341918 [Lipomyces starkeyi]